MKGRVVGGGHRQDASKFSDDEISTNLSADRSNHGSPSKSLCDDHGSQAAYLNASMKGYPVHMLLTQEVTKMLYKMDNKYEKYVRSDNKIAVKMKKALYGCIQSALISYNELPTMIEKMGFKKNPYDLCSYARNKANHTCHIVVYVDVLLITSTSETDLHEVSNKP